MLRMLYSWVRVMGVCGSVCADVYAYVYTYSYVFACICRCVYVCVCVFLGGQRMLSGVLLIFFSSLFPRDQVSH